MPFGGATPTGAVTLDAIDHLPGSCGVAKGDQDLIEYDLVQNFSTACLELDREALREAAVPLDQIA